MSEEAAQWIVKTGKINGVGIDVASVDPGSSEDFRAHRILNENQIYIMENVKILSALPARGFTIYVMPMYLKEGTGAPLRIFVNLKKKKKRSPVPPLEEIFEAETVYVASDGVPAFGHLLVVVSSISLFLLYNFGPDLH